MDATYLPDAVQPRRRGYTVAVLTRLSFTIATIACVVAIVLLWLAAAFPAAQSPDRENWTLSGNADGVAIYRQDVTGSAIVALKGEGVVNAPLWKIAAILLDTHRAPEWVDSLVESRLIRRLTPTSYVEYNHLHLPLTINDREFVSEVHIDVNPANRSVALVYDPINDPSVPTSRRVRGQIVSGSFRARSLGPGRGTALTAEIHCDPKGAIPAWLVNVFQKSWPRKTFEGIRKQAAKPDITMPEPFKALLVPTIEF